METIWLTPAGQILVSCGRFVIYITKIFILYCIVQVQWIACVH